MALIGNITTPDGAEHKEAYLKIESVAYSKDRMNIAYKIYHSKEARNMSLDPIDEDSLICKGEAFKPYGIDSIKVNPIKAGYEYLKVMDRFKGWEDA